LPSSRLTILGVFRGFVGADFTMEHEVPFDQAYMRALFDYGYQKAVHGYPWQKAPPILAQPERWDQVVSRSARPEGCDYT
jgi:hypothetical protein